MGTIDLSVFTLDEVGAGEIDRLWLRGGFPRSFLAADDEASFAWRDAFVRSFLEREAPSVSRSMRTAVRELGLERLWIVVPDGPGWEVHERIAVTPLAAVASAFADAASG